jgi:hypothetical protein
LTGKAARGAETCPEAHFLPAEQPISGERIRLTKILAQTGNVGSNEGLFQAEFEFGDAPRYDQKEKLDGLRHRRNCSMLQK